MLVIVADFRGKKLRFDLATDNLVIGRAVDGAVPDVALNDDLAVAPRHAQVWIAEGRVWIRELESTAGVLINGLKLLGSQAIGPADVVGLGGSTLTMTLGSAEPASSRPAQPAADDEGASVTLKSEMDARRTAVPEFNATSQKQLAMLYELPIQFAAERDVRKLFGLVLRSVIGIIPGAKRGALMVYDRASGKLALRASVPEENPPISRTLIRRAVAQGKGFIWSKDAEMDVSQSMKALSIATGMYCPLMWQGEVQGVICVDTPDTKRSFADSDLRFLIAVAHYAAAALSNSALQADIEFKNKVQDRLLTNFSPKLRQRLVDQARAGALVPGGERSKVTLLMSDIRGFTTTTATMDVQLVVDMLNEYFTELVQVIFDHDGTIDKFIGDAILVVFGSPDPDADQHAKAVKAAIAMQAANHRVNARRKARGEVCCDLGIGLHYGEVLHGFIGAEDRLEFTVIGDTVNRTARYCDGAKKGMVVVSPELHQFMKDKFEFKALSFPTKHEGEFKAFEVIWDDGGISLDLPVKN